MASGLESAVYRAAELGCDCVQVFVKNQRMWRSKPMTGEQVERFNADEIHARCLGFNSMLLLEMTAGQGSAIGYRFEHMRAIIDALREPRRVGVCLDTCHLFVAGYDFRTPQKYEAMMMELDRLIGLARVRCIHRNDSKRELGSRVDRHEHIGKGKIGRKGFASFSNVSRWHGIPMILETPKGKDAKGRDWDEVNLKRPQRYLVP